MELVLKPNDVKTSQDREKGIMVESDVFKDLNYIVKGRHIIISDRTNGVLSVRLENVKALTMEMDEIVRIYRK